MFCSTKTNRIRMFITGLCHWTIIKCQLFTICNIFNWVHADYILSIRYCWYCATIWCARVWKSAWKVSFLYWIYNQHIVTKRLILMLLQINIVKLRNHLFKFLFFQYLLYKILSFIPSPRLINLTKILNDKTTSFNTFFWNTFCSFTFRVNPVKIIIWKHLVSVLFVSKQNWCIFNIWNAKDFINLWFL